MELTKRQKYDVLKAELANERNSFKQYWTELGDYFMPSRLRMNLSDKNRGDRRNTKIIDCTGVIAARTLASGMMSGITSPARPWKRLTTQDTDLSEYGPVKTWLHEVNKRMDSVFLRSNIYNTLPIVYGDMSVIATAPFIVEEDMERVIRSQSFPVGSYYLAKDFRGVVNTFMREFSMTVRQLVEQYGETDEKTGKPKWENFSTVVRNAWDRSQYETWVDVVHVIAPNSDYDSKKLLAKHKKFASCTYEANQTDKNVFLKESGYELFPVLCPRWEVTAEDVYGTNCPGMTALGDVKALQIMQKRKAQAVEKMVNPPMKAPAALRGHASSLIPGGITYLAGDAKDSFTPIHEVRFNLNEARQDIMEMQKLIDRAFYADIVLMLTRSDRDMTATEVAARDQEKLLVFGPVLEQLNQDALNPLIDLTFAYMQRQGMIPPPPEDIQGQTLKVEYESVMAQAQKLVAIGGLDRLANFMLTNHPDPADPARDKVDYDQFIDEIGMALGVPPRVIRSDDAVEEIRAGKAQAAQAEQNAQAMQAVAQSAKNLAGADMSGDNALTRLAQQSQAGQLVPN